MCNDNTQSDTMIQCSRANYNDILHFTLSTTRKPV